uniref:Putative secreted protein n=1 Tax=Anopheles darlingi TaxID=43151 RepID=A0A2M4DAA6_ANODA
MCSVSGVGLVVFFFWFLSQRAFCEKPHISIRQFPSPAPFPTAACVCVLRVEGPQWGTVPPARITDFPHLSAKE